MNETSEEHCDHESVRGDTVPGCPFEIRKEGGPCTHKGSPSGCPYDTRSSPHPALGMITVIIESLGKNLQKKQQQPTERITITIEDGTINIEQPFEFGYFPRNKYKDLVFYVKTGECSNCGLFEMMDTKGNRALMETLARPHLAPETSLTELSAINAALLKLYPDDFALQLNAKQLAREQKEHDSAIDRNAREDYANVLKDGVNCQRVKDGTQCRHCPYRIVKDNGDYDCCIDKALRSHPQHSEQEQPQ